MQDLFPASQPPLLKPNLSPVSAASGLLVPRLHEAGRIPTCNLLHQLCLVLPPFRGSEQTQEERSHLQHPAAASTCPTLTPKQPRNDLSDSCPACGRGQDFTAADRSVSCEPCHSSRWLFAGKQNESRAALSLHPRRDSPSLARGPAAATVAPLLCAPRRAQRGRAGGPTHTQSS